MKGDTGQATWALTTGPLACLPEPVPEINDKGETNLIDPDFKNDATTIMATQKGNIQKDCNLAQGTNRNRDGRAQVLIKSDFNAIVGRRGINLYTSTDSRDSKGPDVGVSDINLIAGNDDAKLQPLVLGGPLRTFLSDKLLPAINTIISYINIISSEQVKMNTALSAHTHPVPAMTVNIPPTTATSVVATAPGTAIGKTAPISVKTLPVITGTSAIVQSGAKASSKEQLVTKAHAAYLSKVMVLMKKNHVDLNNTPEYLFSRNVKAT